MTSEANLDLHQTAPRTSSERGDGASTLSKDIVWTTVTSVAVLVGNAVLASILARRGASEMFEPYNVAKRVAASVMPLVSLGLTVGVVKYVAAQRSESAKRGVVLASLLVIVPVVLLSTALVASSPAVAARVLIGSGDVLLMWAVWLYSIALTVNTMVYAYYRAELRQSRANWANFIAMVAIPLIVVFVVPASYDAAAMVVTMSVCILAVNGAQIAVRAVRALTDAGARTEARRVMRELMTYSLPRIPAGLTTSLILLVGPWMARRGGDTESSAYLLAGLAVAQMVAAGLQAFGIVLLPRVSELHARGRGDDLGRVVIRLLYGGLLLSLASTPFLVAGAEALVPVWLGSEFVRAVPVVRIVALAVPGVVIFSLLRSVADGCIVSPVNTYASTAGLLLAIAVSYVAGASHPEGIAAGYTLGQLLMASWLGLVVMRTLRLRVPPGYLLGVLVVSVALSTASVFIGRALGGAGVTLALTVILGTAVLGGAFWLSPREYGFRSTIQSISRRPR